MAPGSVVESAGLRRSARVTKKRIEDLSVITLDDDTDDDEEWEMRRGRASGRTRRPEGTDSRTSVRDKDVMKPLEWVEEEPPTAHAMAREIEVWSLSDSSDDSDSGSDDYGIEEAEATVAFVSAEDLGLHAHVMKVIEEQGDLNKLRIDHLKAYLRHYGLRLVGVKAVLLDRIVEHLRIKDGQGMELYPRQSFCFDCTGDVVLGDVVLFQQKVYETFDRVSRRGHGQTLGMRWVAGRVVNESYGAGKQQHTFTIEVLWSTGMRPLYPMRPLLIKGRNLYRIHTWRQRWYNEAERQEVRHEKHARGREARAKRAAAKAAQRRAQGSSKSRSDPRHYEMASGPQGVGIRNRNDQVAGRVSYAISAQSIQQDDGGHGHPYTSQGVGIRNRNDQVAGRVGYAISAQIIQQDDGGHGHPYTSQGAGIRNRNDQVAGRVGYAISARSIQQGDCGHGYSYASQGVRIENRTEEVAYFFQQGATHHPYHQSLPMDNISAYSDRPSRAPLQSTNRAQHPSFQGPLHVACSTRGCTNAGAKQCVSTSCLRCCRWSNQPCARHR